jgi:hypothetical protein
VLNGVEDMLVLEMWLLVVRRGLNEEASRQRRGWKSSGTRPGSIFSAMLLLILHGLSVLLYALLERSGTL